MSERLDYETLKKRLRYQGASYSGGSVSRGGSAEIHYLTQAADCIDALQTKIEELEKASQWIPVSERLPENNTRVFVVNKFGQRDIADVYDGAFENCWELDDADETITHWMPLPTRPAIKGEQA